jgi:hypothetical protein
MGRGNSSDFSLFTLFLSVSHLAGTLRAGTLRAGDWRDRRLFISRQVLSECYLLEGGWEVGVRFVEALG